MNFILRLVRLLGIVTWVGGLIFFAFVEAPTAFHVMGTTREFAQLINGSMTTLNRLGHIAGLTFLLATAVLWFREARSPRLLSVQMWGVVLMIAATLYVQHHIIPAMERDRSAAGGDIAALANDNPQRIDFNRLHRLSERVEGSALLLGLLVVGLMAAEPAAPRR